MLGILLIAIFILALHGALLWRSPNKDWNYFPAQELGLVLPVVLILPILGRI
jgi:hypothetical protein